MEFQREFMQGFMEGISPEGCNSNKHGNTRGGERNSPSAPEVAE